MRGRSTETKYGRIPLWLYEAGVSLQAAATYGWLHGRYGHYERVMPSYATLARELGVSRGSVIAYMKELVSAGAVRTETSGAAGLQTNRYVIAFNEPFGVPKELAEGGQNTDHPVSGLYRAGQNADPGGQPVVHEEDVLKKTKKTLSPRASPRPRPTPPLGRGERENPAAPSNDNGPAAVAAAWSAARDGRRNPAAERDIAASALQLLDAGWPLADVTALAEDMARRQPTYRDLTRHADHWQPARPAAGAAPELPPWCGACDGEPLAERWISVADGVARCPDCNPHARAA
jgi:hypothetical protein